MYKREIRALGIDDGPFTFREKRVIVVGVVLRGGGYVEGVLKKSVEVDGSDATDVVESMTKGRYKDQIKVVMIDGISLGGFNVIDIEALSKATEMPIMSVTRDRPDMEKIKTALKNNFEDWERRLKIINNSPLVAVETKNNQIFARFAGMEKDTGKEIMKTFTIRGSIPEPIRLAHLIATAYVSGESHGKA